MSRIQVLAGHWGRHISAVRLGAREDIDLRVCLARAQELWDRRDCVRLGWSIDLVRRAPLRLTKPQGLICFAARLRDGRRLPGATDRETYALIESASTG